MFKYLAKKLLPYLEEDLKDEIFPYLKTIAHRATDAQLATDTLAEKLGYTIIIDSETGVATVHGVTS